LVSVFVFVVVVGIVFVSVFVVVVVVGTVFVSVFVFVFVSVTVIILVGQHSLHPALTTDTPSQR
jgi:hypothetical protein